MSRAALFVLPRTRLREPIVEQLSQLFGNNWDNCSTQMS